VVCAEPAEGAGEAEGEGQEPEAAADDAAEAEVGQVDELLNSPAFLKKKIEVLEEEIVTLKKEKEDLEAKLAEEERSPQVLRLQADFENLRRRTAEQMTEQKELATVECVKQLLPVIDNFDRAATALKATTEEAQSVRSSYQQLYKQLLDAVTKGLGASEIEAEGKEFDFNFHEAMTRQESADVPENHVMAVLKRGFAIGNRLVRPAAVMVSVGPGSKGEGGA